jgi:hypothetical protein
MCEKRLFCRFFTTAAQSGPRRLHAGQLEFDRAIGSLGQIAAEIFAIEHLDVLPDAERGADLRHQLARDIAPDNPP